MDPELREMAEQAAVNELGLDVCRDKPLDKAEMFVAGVEWLVRQLASQKYRLTPTD